MVWLKLNLYSCGVALKFIVEWRGGPSHGNFSGLKLKKNMKEKVAFRPNILRIFIEEKMRLEMFRFQIDK